MKGYMLRMSPWIVRLLTSMGGVVVKWAPRKEVVDSEYMLHIGSIASSEYPRYSMTVNSHGCLTDSKAFLRSM